MRVVRAVVLAVVLLAVPAAGFAVGVGDLLTSFAGTSLNGKEIDLDTALGKKPVLLIFWASWCPNCSREVPKVNALMKKYGTRMLFVGINVGFNDSRERALAFMKKYEMAYPVLFDEKGTLSRKYRVQGVPTVLIADRKGRVVFRNFGVPEISGQDFEKLSR